MHPISHISGKNTTAEIIHRTKTTVMAVAQLSQRINALSLFFSFKFLIIYPYSTGIPHFDWFVRLQDNGIL